MMVRQKVSIGLVGLLNIALLAGCGAPSGVPAGNTGASSSTTGSTSSSVPSAIGSSASPAAGSSTGVKTTVSSAGVNTVVRIVTKDPETWFPTAEKAPLLRYYENGDDCKIEEAEISAERLEEVFALLKKKAEPYKAIRGIVEYAVNLQDTWYKFNVTQGWVNLGGCAPGSEVTGLKFSKETAKKLETLLTK